MLRACVPVLLLICSLATSASAGREAVFGTWGTAAQCNRDPVLPGGSKLAEPYVIAKGWLRQGDLWCLLIWFDDAKTGSATSYLAARAVCGEDSVQIYALGLHLDGEALTLIWNDQIVTGPLGRCAGDQSLLQEHAPRTTNSRTLEGYRDQRVSALVQGSLSNDGKSATARRTCLHAALRRRSGQLSPLIERYDRKQSPSPDPACQHLMHAPRPSVGASRR